VTGSADRWVSRQCTVTTSTKGVAVIERFGETAELAGAIESELEVKGERLVRSRSDVPRLAILDEGGERSYTVIGRTALSSVLPDIAERYDSVRHAADTALDLPVLLSTHEESSVTAKTYGPGDSQGWHLDTNPVTALYLLRVSPGVPPVLWEDAAGRTHALKCSAGDLAIFEGKRIRHCVPLHEDGDTTVMVLFNLYLPDDRTRPPEMDQFALHRDGQRP
jgi:hypothetical protein